MTGVTVLVDDVRSFSDRRACCTARSSDAGVALLRALRGVRIEHLWLDHDLIRDDTVWPVVHLLDDAALAGEPFDVGTVHVHAARSGPAHEVVVSLRRAGYNVERSTDLRLWRRTARMSTGQDPVGEWTTERAVQLAIHHHEGQRDRGDPSIPYVTHPLRVMAAVRAAGYDERYQRVAVLHDGLEDTRLEATDLREGGAPEEEVEAVLSVTKRPGEGNYPDRVQRAAANEIGGVVKGFDMLDNSDSERLATMARRDAAKAEGLREKYAGGLQLLDQLRPGWRRAGTA